MTVTYIQQTNKIWVRYWNVDHQCFITEAVMYQAINDRELNWYKDQYLKGGAFNV